MSGEAQVSAAPGHFVKTAGDAGHAARLLRQAELLAFARVPGVVSLVGLDGPPHDPVLVTARVDGPDLARGPELTAEEVAALVAALAVTLADLHDLGIVHGAVMAEHVLLSSDGRPVLCGFGYGGRTGERPVAEAPLPEPAVDPARGHGGPLFPASDVLALGALLGRLLDTAETAPLSKAQVDALRAVAARTSVPNPALRPSARAVAEAVRHAVPSARLPGPPRPGNAGGHAEPKTNALHALRAGPALQALRRGGGAHHLPLGRRRRNLKAVPLALAAIALGAFVVRASANGSQSSGPAAEAPAPAPSSGLPLRETAPETAPPPTDAPPVPPTGALPREDCPAISGLMAADTDGDGCPEALRWEGGVVEAGDRRWSVGQPGDVAVTGDWTCVGVATLAVLRPSTGQVFVFDGWATHGQDLSVLPAARLDGAFALRAAEIDADACPDLVVERAGRPPAVVPVPAGRP